MATLAVLEDARKSLRMSGLIVSVLVSERLTPWMDGMKDFEA